MIECHLKGRLSGTLEITRIRVAFFIPSGSPEDWSRLVSISDDYRSDWWFSLPLSWVLGASAVASERLHRRCLAWGLVWGRDQEATGQGEREGEGDQGH